MKFRKILSLLITCLFALGCLTAPVAATTVSNLDAQVITRATDRIEATIFANKIAALGDSVSLDSGEVVTFNFTYTPKSASIKFGVIAPDGYFYGVEGSSGSIDKGIRVEQRGTYTLAIWNKSDEAVTVEGTVNY